MAIEYVDVNEHLRRIILSGRLDTAGSEEIATKFAALAASARRGVVVDLTDVTFLASMGLRSIITNAKAQQHRGGRLVLLVGGNESVTKTLTATGIDTLIPMFTDTGGAEQAALEYSAG
jgi:anti-sigma B factor antagonist